MTGAGPSSGRGIWLSRSISSVRCTFPRGAKGWQNVLITSFRWTAPTIRDASTLTICSLHVWPAIPPKAGESFAGHGGTALRLLRRLMARRDAPRRFRRAAAVWASTRRATGPQGGDKSLLGSDLEPRPYPNAKKSPEMAMFYGRRLAAWRDRRKPWLKWKVI